MLALRLLLYTQGAPGWLFRLCPEDAESSRAVASSIEGAWYAYLVSTPCLLIRPAEAGDQFRATTRFTNRPLLRCYTNIRGYLHEPSAMST